MIALTQDRLRGVLAGIVIVLLAVPVGGALYLGVALGESPCILCWAQRTSMVLIALVAIFVVRYGPRPRYLGMVVLLAAWGTFMALRHSALHLARDIGQGFSGAILGAHTYVWAWVIHWIVLLVIGALLLLLRGPLQHESDVVPPRPIARFAMALLVIMASLNALQAFVSTGPPPFIGQGDPIRMSLNPKHWVWSLDELEGPISLRGSWTVPKPEAMEYPTNIGDGPLLVPRLPIMREERITASIDGRLTDFAIAPDGRALAVTDQFAVYLLDPTFAQVLHRVVLDRGFSIDLSPLAGAAFLNGDTLAVLSDNKSFVLLRPDAAADPVAQFRYFRESDGGVSEVRRSRFATLRARQQYVLSLAYDETADELITISIPSPRHQRVVVSRFDRGDMLLSSEFLLEPDSTLVQNGSDRSVAEYVITGATARDGMLYAISAAHGTLLAIDLRARRITAAWMVPGLHEPVGLAVRADELLIAQADGRIAVVARPAGR